jgi:hypothetical protein
MNDFLQSYDLKENFWKVNPNLDIIPEFMAVKKADKSKNKEQSSQVMWALFLLFHRKSPYTGSVIEDKKMLIADDYLGNKDFKWDKDSLIARAMEVFKQKLISPQRRLLYEWQEKLEERSKFIASIKYNQDTSDLLDKMLEKTHKMFEMYNKALKDLSEEEKEGVTEGNAEESLSEKGII